MLQADLGELQGLQSGFKGPVSMIDGGLFDSVKAYKDSKVRVSMGLHSGYLTAPTLGGILCVGRAHSVQ